MNNELGYSVSLTQAEFDAVVKQAVEDVEKVVEKGKIVNIQHAPFMTKMSNFLAIASQMALSNVTKVDYEDLNDFLHFNCGEIIYFLETLYWEILRNREEEGYVSMPITKEMHQRLIGICLEMLSSKGKEYGADVDRFVEINEAAEFGSIFAATTGVVFPNRQLTVLMGYMMKHTTSVMRIISRHMAKEDSLYEEMDKVQEKVVDQINYIILMMGAVYVSKRRFILDIAEVG